MLTVLVAVVALLVGIAIGVALAWLARGRLSEQFKAVAGSVLVDTQRELRAQGQGELDERRRQVTDAFEHMNRTLQGIEESRKSEEGGLLEKVQSLADTTDGLRRTLGSSAERGTWGEFKLHRLVELAGMDGWCDFDEQIGISGPDGSVRPDMVVRLPGDRTVAIDSKAPLDSFRDAYSTDDPQLRSSKLGEGAKALRSRVKDLSSKAYWEKVPGSLDFVVLFVPVEGVLASALEHDPALMEDAVEKRVVLVGPASLLAVLRSFSYGWRQDVFARQAAEVRAQAAELYSRLETVIGHLATLGASVEKTAKAYNTLVGSVEGRLLPSAKRMHEAGVSATEIGAPPLAETAIRAVRPALDAAPSPLGLATPDANDR